MAKSRGGVGKRTLPARKCEAGGRHVRGSVARAYGRSGEGAEGPVAGGGGLRKRWEQPAWLANFGPETVIPQVAARILDLLEQALSD